MSASAALSTAVQFRYQSSGATVNFRESALFERYMRWYGFRDFSALPSARQSGLKPSSRGLRHLTADDVRILDAALFASGRIIHEGEYRER
jgi:hypothetical protein